jgi:hypothetical protein
MVFTYKPGVHAHARAANKAMHALRHSREPPPPDLLSPTCDQTIHQQQAVTEVAFLAVRDIFSEPTECYSVPTQSLRALSNQHYFSIVRPA